MAIFHLSMGHVSRSTGRSCVQSVAYITKTKLTEERRGLNADYRGDIEVSWETLAPEGCGVDRKNVSDIWNRIENYEDEYALKRYKNPETHAKYRATARTAQTYVFALPKELTHEQNTDLIREICQERFVALGLVATYGIHWEEGNPHAHIQVSTRSIDKESNLSYVKTARILTSPSALRETRKLFADKTNALFKSLGMSERIDHRSYAERGLELIPGKHKGYIAHHRERDGLRSELGTQNQLIFEANKDRIGGEPGIILKELTSKNATFSELDVKVLAQKRLGDELSAMVDHVVYTVMTQAVKIGVGIDNALRYTSQEYFDKEAQVLSSFQAYQGQKAAIEIKGEKIDSLMSSLDKAASTGGMQMNEGQKNAIRTLCGDARLSILIGRAGTGKTTTLAHVVDLHKEAGYDVWGMAPSATAAAQLTTDTGNKSDTLAHYAHYWRQYHAAVENIQYEADDQARQAYQSQINKLKPYLPTDKTLVLIDEAGMIGIGSWKDGIANGWDALVKTLDLTGAKLILTGDNHQFKPVDTGDVLRHLVDKHRDSPALCQLDEIIRQRTPWMREASQELAELNTGTALEMYEHQGHVQEYVTSIHVYEEMAAQYLRNVLKAPDDQGIVLAGTNKECQALNGEIRSMLKANGLLAQEDIFQQGEEGYTVGERIVFTKNDRECSTTIRSREEGFFVRNGMQAIIQSIQPCQYADDQTGKIISDYKVTATVAAQGSPDHKVTFNIRDYPHFSHGYAVTGHKAQGLTVDWSLVKLGRFMDAHVLYVSLTRHRAEVGIYYSNEDFADFAAVARSAGRVSYKDLVADYTITDAHRELWQNVQDYKELGREMQGLRLLAQKVDKEQVNAIWEDYRSVEGDRKLLASLILDNRQEHRDFVRQGGLTFEGLEIAAGVRQRPLSRLEVQARATVEQYACVALEARQTWRDIRRSHPGVHAKSHPDWVKFDALKSQRGVLANTIHQNPSLHRSFLRDAMKEFNNDPGASQNLSWGMGTIKVQAEAHQSKMLQQALLRSTPDGDTKMQLGTLLSYIDSRDQAAAIWSDIRPKLKDHEGTLLKESFGKAIDEYTQMRIVRDDLAGQIIIQREALAQLAGQVGIALDFDKLQDQAVQSQRDKLFKAYQPGGEESTRLAAAFGLSALVQAEADQPKKITLSQIYQQGYQPRSVTQDALEYQKIAVFQGLKTPEERQVFMLLDEYDSHCRQANALYSQCAADVKDKPDLRAWHSDHYPAYKAACERRNTLALEVFDQRDHGQVLAMADKMGLRLKDVDLDEVYARCQQAERSRCITNYLSAGPASDAKGQAAITLRQMIALERAANTDKSSVTAQQAHHGGINFKDLQETAFSYGRTCLLRTLSNPADIATFHKLTVYEEASRLSKAGYKTCIDEAQANTTVEKTVKPWETEAFKTYLTQVRTQDGYSHDLVKDQDQEAVNRLANDMGISVKGIDLASHRHELRQTLELYTSGDRSNVPMAAYELLNWLAFDRDEKHYHTFKVLREDNLLPKDLQDTLAAFHQKKRAYKQDIQRRSATQAQEEKPTSISLSGSDKPEPRFETIYHEQKIPRTEVEQQLRGRLGELTTFLMEGAYRQSGNVWQFGRKGSVKVHMHGPKQGLYSNFESGIHGGPLKMIEDQMALSCPKDALDWARDWLGGNRVVIEHRPIEPEKAKKTSTWQPITPVPNNVTPADIVNNKYLNYYIKEGYTEVARHAYRNEDSELLGYVYRFERTVDGRVEKITPPLSYQVNQNGFKAWQWKGFETKDRHAYGVERLKVYPDKPVLVVEGEKTADAAQKLLPDYVVLTWAGGAGAVGNTNWQSLTDRQVVVWPDNDEGGIKAAAKLENIVTKLNQEQGKTGTIGIVNLPDWIEQKWDLADKLPESWTIDTVKSMIKSATIEKPTMLEVRVTEKENISQDPVDRLAKEFIDICMVYENLPWNHPNDAVTFDKMAALGEKHMVSTEFRDAVVASKNEVAIEKLQHLMLDSPHLIPGVDIDNFGKEVPAAKQTTPILPSAKEFIDTCMLYKRLPSNHPDDIPTYDKMEALARKHMSSEEFRNMVEQSGNHYVIDRLKQEMSERPDLVPEVDIDSFGKPKTHSGQDLHKGSAYSIDNVRKAAAEFVDLCILYNKLPSLHKDEHTTINKIDKMSQKYMHLEEFREVVFALKENVAVEKLKLDIEQQKAISRSMSQGI